MKIPLRCCHHFPEDKVMNAHTYERYQRQILLKEFGETAQQKLQEAAVLVIGAGGLGCPALQYLTAAGVGTIGIVDFDSVELSNLHRQILFTVNDIGKPKAEVAAQKLQLVNPGIKIDVYPEKLGNKNAWDIISPYQLVIDGSDNFVTRYLVNDACVLLNKPLIYGAVLKFEGQVAVFNYLNKSCSISVNYRNLFPHPPLPENVPSCNEAGVIGVLPGIIGTMQAAEAIKIITGIGEPLCNKLLCFNMLNNRFYEMMITPDANETTAMPANQSAFEKFDYEWHCGLRMAVEEISVDDFDRIRENKTITVIDVREIGELPFVDEFPFIQMPLSSLPQNIEGKSLGNSIVVFCQSGKRSIKAVKMLQENLGKVQVYSLKGGIEAWKKQHLNKAIL